MKARVLIVDDEPAMLRSVERILSDDYEVRTAPSPSDGLRLAEEFRPQLAVVDVQMPEMDGFELTAKLKELDPHMQVILMTGSLYGTDEKLIRGIREKAFYFITKPFDRDVLRTLVQRALELHSLDEKNRLHTQRLEKDFAEARAFQRTMLPPGDADVDGVRIHAEHRPCEELAGDLYDYAPAGGGRIGLVVADVVGHGASAAMLTGIVKASFHSSQKDDYDPEAVVRRVAAALASFDAHRFVTMIAARIAPEDGAVEFVNAGHEGGVVIGDGSVVRLDSTGPVVSAAFRHVGWRRRQVDWSHRSVLLLYTDGITETTKGEETFGTRRLEAAALSARARPEELLSTVLGEVEHFSGGRPPGDDVTLLAAWQSGSA